MRFRRVVVLAGALAVMMILTGCAVKALPTYSDVRSETEAAMQQIADAMPAGSRVEDVTVATPYGCSDGGVFFTGHWFVHGPEGFDTRTFIEGLSDMVADEFSVEPPGVVVTYPAVLLRSRTAIVRLDVSNPNDDEYPGIDILAMSRCAQAPEESNG